MRPLLLLVAVLAFYAAAPYLLGALLYPLLALACGGWWIRDAEGVEWAVNVPGISLLLLVPAGLLARL